MEKDIRQLGVCRRRQKQNREESTDAWRYSPAASTFIQTYRGRMILWLSSPAEAGEKHFDFEERVKLVNPRITAEGYKIGTRGFTNYILHADDMVKA